MKIFTKITTCLLIALALGATVMSCKKDVEKVEVSPATVTLEVAKSTQLSATVTPDKAEYTLAWSSSNPAVAIVDNNGKVTAITEGTATISAEAGGKKGTCEVTVASNVPAPTNLQVTDKTAVSATLTWTGTADSYEVGVGAQTYTTTTSSYNVGDLTPGQSYTWKVRAKVGDKFSAWVNGPDFSTLTMSDGLTVIFGDAPAWTAAYIQGAEAVSAGVMEILAAQNAPSDGNISFPIVDILTENTVGAIDLTTSLGYLEYYEVTALQNQQGTRFGDWWCVDQDEARSYYGDGTPTVNITALANGKISGNVSVVMFNAKEKYIDQNANFSTRNLTVYFQNVELQTAKKMMQSFQKRHTIANTNNLKLSVKR